MHTKNKKVSWKVTVGNVEDLKSEKLCDTEGKSPQRSEKIEAVFELD